MLGEWSMLTYWRGMSGGDPVAWGITLAVIALLGAGLYWDNRRKADTEAKKDE